MKNSPPFRGRRVERPASLLGTHWEHRPALGCEVTSHEAEAIGTGKQKMTTIIGSGLLARSFSKITFSRDCLVLAAGVSNSSEQRDSEFRREAEVVEAAIRKFPSSRVIYFSTCSILQKDQTPYILHKLAMESLVAALSSSFHIFRLPQVVGATRNMTLVSYLVESVLRGRRVLVQAHARRNLVDVNDVNRLIHHLIEHDIGRNSIQTLAAAHSVHVREVLEEIGELLQIAPICDVVDAGESYDIQIDFVKTHFGHGDPLMKTDYWQSVLRKNVSIIASKIRSTTICPVKAGPEF